MSFRTHLMACWFEVYLKTASNSTPIDRCDDGSGQPARHDADRGEQERPREIARRSNQAAACASADIIRCNPGREADQKLALRLVRS